MLKSALRKVAPFYAINAAIKSAWTKQQYRRTLARYRNRRGAAPLSWPTLRGADADRLCNIFFVGTDEQQDRSGLLQALQRLGNLRWFTRGDGSYGQNDPRPETVRRKANAHRLWELVTQAAAEGHAPDILLAQTWSTLMDPQVFDRIRAEYGTLVVNISMDDRHQYWGRPLAGSWSGTFGLIGHIDLALTAAPECVQWYEAEGCPASYFPEASDPDIFRPMPELPKIHDVSFVGACYGIRRDLVAALRKAGVRVTTFGSGWNSGRIPTENVPTLFAQSKIILGVGTIGHCRDFYALKMRDFDGPMSGSLYLTHDNPDLATLFERDREIATYSPIAECVEKVRYYLREEGLRETIAASGRARCVKQHTWLLRFKGLFEKLRPADRLAQEASA